MATNEELREAMSDALLEALITPKSMMKDDKRIEMRDGDDLAKLNDLIPADAATKPRFGVRYSVFEPPGCG